MMLTLNNISKTFAPGTVNEKKALDGVTLHLNKGDFVTVLGSNGAGKSTLFNAIAGTFAPDCGTIALRLDLPSECLKLVSAVIVAVAIALPAIRKSKGGKAKC